MAFSKIRRSRNERKEECNQKVRAETMKSWKQEEVCKISFKIPINVQIERRLSVVYHLATKVFPYVIETGNN